MRVIVFEFVFAREFPVAINTDALYEVLHHEPRNSKAGPPKALGGMKGCMGLG